MVHARTYTHAPMKKQVCLGYPALSVAPLLAQSRYSETY